MAVCSDIFLFILCLLIVGALVFVLIYFIITLSDLECDYLNAQECCAKLNFVSSKILIMNHFFLFFKKIFVFSILVEYSKVMVSIVHCIYIID